MQLQWFSHVVELHWICVKSNNVPLAGNKPFLKLFIFLFWWLIVDVVAADHELWPMTHILYHYLNSCITSASFILRHTSPLCYNPFPLINVVNTVVSLMCAVTRDICCTSVRPGRGIPTCGSLSLWGFISCIPCCTSSWLLLRVKHRGCDKLWFVNMGCTIKTWLILLYFLLRLY